MRVAHIFLSMPVGGAEVLVQRLLTGLAECDVRCVCLRSLDVIGGEILAAAPGKIKLVPVACSRRLSPWGILRLAHWLGKTEADVVHTHVYNAHVYGVLAAKLAGIPAVMHHHKSWRKLRPHRMWLMRLVSRLAAAHVTLSSETRSDVCRNFDVSPRRVHVLSNPLEEHRPLSDAERRKERIRLGLKPDLWQIGTIASLTPPKNPLMNARMFSQLCERLPGRVQFSWFGEGRMRVEIEAQLRIDSIESDFFLHGLQRPISPRLLAMDVFVLCSDWEGQSIALLQAISHDVPAVVSRIEGNTAIVGEDFPALFDLHDDDGYSRLVERVLTDSRFRHRVLAAQETLKKKIRTEDSFRRDVTRIYESAISAWE